jgi:hypothetical protein
MRDFTRFLQFALVTLLLAASDGCAHRSPQPENSRGLYGNSIVSACVVRAWKRGLTASDWLEI